MQFKYQYELDADDKAHTEVARKTKKERRKMLEAAGYSALEAHLDSGYLYVDSRWVQCPDKSVMYKQHHELIYEKRNGSKELLSESDNFDYIIELGEAVGIPWASPPVDILTMSMRDGKAITNKNT